MSVRVRTVLIVAPYFPPHAGGLERYVYEVGKRLVCEKGWRVVVVTSGALGGKDGTELRDGMKIYRFGYCMRVSNTPIGLLWPIKIRMVLRKERPDIINIHTPVPGMGEMAALVAGRVPVVVTYHAGSMKKGSPFTDPLIVLYEHAILPRLLRRAARIVCSSDAIRTDFLRRYANKSITIPPAVDTDVFSPSTASRQAGTVLFVASDLTRATAYKGLFTLIQAMELLRSKGTPTRLQVVGDGDMRKEYETTSATLGLAPSVKFLGRLSGSALTEAYQRADMFVLPTSNDSYPSVILEAMASGLPVISTTVGDIPRMIDDGKTGFCVEPADSVALAEKMEQLLCDPARRGKFGAAGRAKIEAEMDWGERATRYDELFRSVIGKKHVTYISAYYPPHVGGIERVVEMTSGQLSLRGHEVTVLTSNGTLLESRVRSSGTRCVKYLTTFEFAHTPFAPSLFLHLLRVPRGSILHLHLAQAYWPEVVRFAAFIRRMPYIVHFHLDVAPSGILGPLFLAYKKRFWGPLLRGAKAVIVCTPAQGSFLEEVYGVPHDNIGVVGNAIDGSYFAARPARATPGTLQLLFIGRFAPQKRLEFLIEMMRHLDVPAHLTLAGGGEQEAALTRSAKRLGVSNITFLGPQSESEMQTLHAKSDIFVISSEREGLPLAVLEAMAAGLPVVGVSAPGVREVVEGAGLVVTQPEPAALARAVEELSKDAARMRLLSQRCREKAENYRLAPIIESLEDIYRSV